MISGYQVSAVVLVALKALTSGRGAPETSASPQCVSWMTGEV